MLKLLVTRRVAAATLFLSAIAYAAPHDSWNYITRSPDGLVSFYGDHKSITLREAIRRARVLYNYKEPQLDPDTLVTTRSTIAVTLADCRKRKLAGIEGTDYAGPMGSGKILSRSRQLPNAAPEYVEAKSGSADEAVLNYICGTPHAGKLRDAAAR